MKLTWKVLLKLFSEERLKRIEMSIAILGCKGCGNCRSSCPEGALVKSGNETRVDYSKCKECKICIEACPYHAIIWID